MLPVHKWIGYVCMENNKRLQACIVPTEKNIIQLYQMHHRVCNAASHPMSSSHKLVLFKTMTILHMISIRIVHYTVILKCYPSQVRYLLFIREW